jgi:hypothetical protein
LEIDPQKRITVEEILNHPWLWNEDEYSYSSNGKIKSKLNLFTNAERILLSKSNIDYRNASKDDMIEIFTLKNLDTLQECENQNVATKSLILAPFNSSIKNINQVEIPSKNDNNEPKIENDAIKYCGKAKELNRNYELNNNGEIDNGILINPNNVIENKSNEMNNKYDDIKSNKISRKVSQPASPPDMILSELQSPKPDSNRNSRKNKEIANANTFVLGNININITMCR